MSVMPSLRQVRRQRLLTMRELAALAGVAPSTIYSIESGRTKPLLRVIRQLAAALQVEPGAVDEFRRTMEEAGDGEPPSGRWSDIDR